MGCGLVAAGFLSKKSFGRTVSLFMGFGDGVNEMQTPKRKLDLSTTASISKMRNCLVRL